MELSTASEVINFAIKLEDDSQRFYESLAQRYEEGRELFLSFAREGDKNKTTIRRTYYEVISDALETSFSFEGLNIDDYLIETETIEAKDYFDAVKMAIELKKKARKFYLGVAERSRSLMADVLRAFEQVARRREKREQKLRSLLEKGD